MASASVFTLAAVVALLVGEARGPRWLPWVAKPAASFGFLLAAFDAAPADAGGWAIAIGLVACLVGDVCLLSRTKAWFLAGLGAFFLGHVAYGIGFSLRGLEMSTTVVASAVLAGPAIVVWRWLRPHVEPDMRGPVVAYVIAVSGMVACAIGSSGPRGEWVLVLGAVAFYLSDLSVARDVFVRRAFLNRLWGLPLYYAAQLCIATAV